MRAGVRIGAVQGPEEIANVHALFLEYARSLDFSLCFQGFDDELATLPGGYAPPRGDLWLAWEGEKLPESSACARSAKTDCAR